MRSRPRASILAASAAFVGLGGAAAETRSITASEREPAPRSVVPTGRGLVVGRPSPVHKGRGWYAGEHGTPSRRSLRLRGRSRGARRARKARNR